MSTVCKINSMYLLTKWEGRMEKYLTRGQGVRAQRGPCAMTESQIFSHPARPNYVTKYFIMTNLETNLLEVLTGQAVRFYSRAVRLVPAPLRQMRTGPHTRLSSMVLQWKRSQGCTGHMIKRIICKRKTIKQKSTFIKLSKLNWHTTTVQIKSARNRQCDNSNLAT